jgi:transcriptional regulator with XRE-family HTH domain
MVPSRPNPRAGQRLKAVRKSLGLSTRDVQRKSQQIAIDKHNQEYYISHAWLTALEQEGFMVRICKLYSISAIYHKSFAEIAEYFGVRIADLGRDSASIALPRTHLVGPTEDGETQSVSLPVEFKPEFPFEATTLLARVVEKLVPIGLLQHLDLRKSMYGYIGLQDTMLHPLIRPGSLVQIDPSQRKISKGKWASEFDRPIYFIELRDGYLCSWCQLERGQLIAIPHPQSGLAIRHFEYPAQAEVVGRVTGVAMRIGNGDNEKEDKPGGGRPSRA